MSPLVREGVSSCEVKVLDRVLSATVPAACVRVCFRMFSRAASTSATRSVSPVSQAEQAGLDLAGPGRRCL